MGMSMIKMLRHRTTINTQCLIPLWIPQWFLKDPFGGRKRPTPHYWEISPQLVHFLLEWTSKSLLTLYRHSFLPSWATLPHSPNFTIHFTKMFLIQWKLQCVSEHYSNFMFHCPEILRSTVSYLRSTSVKQLRDQFDKCCSRLQLSRAFLGWNLALDSLQFPLNCKIACQGKGGEPPKWDFKTELSKAVQNIPRKKSCMGRQRCKEPFSFIETLRLLLNVLDFNSVYYSRHERHLAKIGTR